MVDEPVKVVFGADTAGAEQGIDRVGDKLRNLNPVAREVFEAFGELRKTFIEAFAVREISEFISKVAELGEQAIRSSEMLGMSVEEVERLGFAAKLVGGSTESMTMSLMRLERNMAEAGNSSSKASQAFLALGISADDIKNKSPDQVLGMIADAFQGAQNGADKTAIAMDLMGRAGAQMIPLLNQGSEGLKQMGIIADGTGTVLNEVQNKGLANTNKALVTLHQTVTGAGVALFEVFHPAIDATIQGLTGLVEVITEAIKIIRVMANEIEAGLIISMAALVNIFNFWKTIAVEEIEIVKISFETLGKIIDDVVHLHFDKAVADWEAGCKRIVEAQNQASKALEKGNKDYEDFRQKVIEATDALLNFATADGKVSENEGKKKLHAPTGGGAGKEDKTDLQNAKNDLATQLELDKLAIQSKKDMDQEKVASGQMTRTQELNDLISFTGQEQQLNMKAIDDEAKLYDEDSAEYHALLNKKKVMTAEYNNEILKLNAQIAQESKKQYDAFFNSITQGMDKMVDGVLQGTQTWKQAMGKLFDDLVLKFINDFVIKAVVHLAESYAQQIGLAQAFKAAMAALNLSSAATAAPSVAADAAINVPKVTADAAVAFAGVFANQAPILGPGAAVPAAAAYSAVMAQIPQASLDVGAYNLSGDMVAQLHQGEMVIPQTFAEGLRNGGGSIGGGSSPTINFTIQAIDTQSGAQFLKNNAANISNIISTQIRNGNNAFNNTARS